MEELRGNLSTGGGEGVRAEVSTRRNLEEFTYRRQQVQVGSFLALGNFLMENELLLTLLRRLTGPGVRNEYRPCSPEHVLGVRSKLYIYVHQ